MIWLLAVILFTPLELAAQTTEDAAAAETNYKYSQAQLDSLLAPIALYPDPLLSQILMASTYPLEIVEADRWVKANPNLSGDNLDNALKSKPWDVSVKSLCHFPKVLAMMSDKLDQTQSLGDAFLSQPDQVMNTIQSLRARAQAEGNLKTNDQQKVVMQAQYISVEPVSPDVIYVPVYNPCWVYGPWWYPVCSPAWFWWPGIGIEVGFFWGFPIFVGPIDFWCGFFWPRHRLFVNVNKTTVVGRVGITRLHGGIEVWQHNPLHRRGVAYRNPAIAHQFGQIQRPGIEARRAFRGFAPRGRTLETPARPGGTMHQLRPEGGHIGEMPRRRGEISVPRTPSFQRPATISPFEGFGHTNSEVRQHSERGFESMGGGSKGGGGFRSGSGVAPGGHGRSR